MNNMYDILELCVQELENGADLESVLSRHPEQAEELRPLLRAAVSAKTMAVSAPSEDVVRRNRAKLLQHAAQMREGENKPYVWFFALQRWAMVFVILFVFLFAGTRLITASAEALPGDGLYPAKGVVENVSLWLTFDAKARDELRVQYADERLREVNELLVLGISARVDFAGVVTEQRGDAWQIAGIPVFVTSQTQLPNEPVQVGVAVRVYGITRVGFVVADRVEFLPDNSALPGNAPIFEAETPTATPVNTQPGQASATMTPGLTVTPSPSQNVTPTSAPGNFNSNTNQNNSNNNQNQNDNDDVDDNDNDD